MPEKQHAAARKSGDLTICGRYRTLTSMKRISASELKARLGTYIQAVRNGAVLLVTDRGVPVASLAPVAPPVTVPVLEYSRLAGPHAVALGKLACKPLKGKKTRSTLLLRNDRDRR